jgi:S1-C subfamily serine protease
MVISKRERIMPDVVEDLLIGLSDALVERTRRARPLVARIEVEGHPMRSGTLWRKDVVIAADQALAHVEEAKVVLGDGSSFVAHLAGRDPGTNVLVLRLDGTVDPAPVVAAEPHPGTLVVAFGAEHLDVCARLGVIHAVGPACTAEPAAASIGGSLST